MKVVSRGVAMKNLSRVTVWTLFLLAIQSHVLNVLGNENLASSPAPARIGVNLTAPPAPIPATAASQRVQFQQVLSSLRLNNYTMAAQMLAEYLFYLPLNSTVFVPTNGAFRATGRFPPMAAVLPYHAVPQQLSYDQILLLPVNTRLTTLIPGDTILVTGTGASQDFRLDDVRVLEGNVCSTNTSSALTISCHAVDTVLNVTKWGRVEAVAAPPGASSAGTPPAAVPMMAEPIDIIEPTPGPSPLTSTVFSPSSGSPSALLSPAAAAPAPGPAGRPSDGGVAKRYCLLSAVLFLSAFSAASLVV